MSWVNGTWLSAPPRPVPDPGVAANREGWFDPCLRDHNFARRGPRSEVVADLAGLLYQVQKLRPREIDRNPAGVLGERGAGDVFLFGGPCAGDEVAIPTGLRDYRVPVPRRCPPPTMFDSASYVAARPSFDVARYRVRVDESGAPRLSTDGRQIFEFGGME